MTFTVHNIYTGETYIADIETFDELISLADGYNLLTIDIDPNGYTVTIGRP